MSTQPHVLREYALLADGERGALVGPHGDFAWMCFPRWHDDALFASLLGGGGAYTVRPAGRHVSPVELDAVRAARPARWRLAQVKPLPLPAADNLGVLSNARVGTRATGESLLPRGWEGAAVVRSGCVPEGTNPAGGVRAVGRICPCSFNAAGVGSFPPATGEDRSCDRGRRPGQIPGGEKLNHERGESPCQ